MKEKSRETERGREGREKERKEYKEVTVEGTAGKRGHYYLLALEEERLGDGSV